MKLIGKDIKLYEFNTNDSFSVGMNNRSYVINGKNIGHCVWGNKTICDSEITVNIDNEKIFLTKDNILLIKVHRTVIDLNTKQMYKEDTRHSFNKLKVNLSDRTFIKVKNS
jgi:23S rRNA maturation-related 3'-5' exoribonuclease YhaM